MVPHDLIDSIWNGGIIMLGLGSLAAIILQIMLMVRLRKFILTFLPVLFSPNGDLLSNERLIKKMAIYLLAIGSLAVAVSAISTYLMG